ncbi:MAG: hypothetical protein JWL95_2466 [Gemmatimonadetes bacterium]|nr:hypothetical protein [Gemmatimonadota bacterium]
MNAPVVLFGAFAFLAAWNAGAMTTLQIQHYRIYPLVGRGNFAVYLRANNRAAVVPVILPAMLLLVTSVLLLVARPRFMSVAEVAVALALNVAHLASTFMWQRPLQAEMARTGYDEAKTKLLVSTNWIRTVCFLTQALLATKTVLQALGSV